MKKNFKTILMSMLALATLSLGSCSKEDVTVPIDPSNPPVVEGISTYATFSMKIEGASASSRAGMVTAPETDNAVTSIRILVFDDADGIPVRKLVANMEADAEALAAKKISFSTTSGKKRFFVIANNPATSTPGDAFSKIRDLKVGDPIETLYAIYTNPTDDAPVTTTTEFDALVTTGALFMSSGASGLSKFTLAPGITPEQSTNGVDATTNSITIKIKRSVAKGSIALVAKDGTDITAGIPINGGVYSLDKEEIKFGVRNINRSVNLIQQFENDITNDADENEPPVKNIRPYAPYYNTFNGIDSPAYENYYYGGYPIAGVDAKAVNAVAFAGTPTRTSVYFTENSNNKATRGNVTYFGISAKVKSIVATSFSDGIAFNQVKNLFLSEKPAVDVAYAGEDFYVIRTLHPDIKLMEADGTTESSRYVFMDKVKAAAAAYEIFSRIENFLPAAITKELFAAAFAVDGAGYDDPIFADNNFDIKKHFGIYTGGMNYFRLNITEIADNVNKDVFNMVRRNHNYVATITGFSKLGEPTEEDLDRDPDKPVDQQSTSVTATIVVQGWHDVVIDGGDL